MPVIANAKLITRKVKSNDRTYNYKFASILLAKKKLEQLGLKDIPDREKTIKVVVFTEEEYRNLVERMRKFIDMVKRGKVAPAVLELREMLTQLENV